MTNTPSATMPRRALLVWFVRLAVSAAVLAVIFRLVPVEQVWHEARKLSPALWLGGLLVFLLGHAAAAAKWRLLIGPGISYPDAFRAHLAGLAANLCLPSVAGGDLVRASLVRGKAKDPAQLAAGSVADRLIDTAGLALIAALGGVMAFGAGSAARQAILFAAVALVGLGGLTAAVLLAPRFLATRPIPGRIGRALTAAVRALEGLARRPARLFACLAISMVIQALFVGVNIAFADAAGVEAPAAAWFYAWSAAKIIAIAPVSLGGLGVREASVAALLTPFGADTARVVAVGLVWQTVLYASGLVGLLAQVVWAPKRRPVPSFSPPASAEPTS